MIRGLIESFQLSISLRTFIEGNIRDQRQQFHRELPALYYWKHSLKGDIEDQRHQSGRELPALYHWEHSLKGTLMVGDISLVESSQLSIIGNVH